MDYRRLGQSDLNVSAVCLGTMTFGQQNTEAQAHAQLDYAFSQGVNFIDTAELYPVPTRAETYGRTESFVGSWLRKQARDKVILATKIAGPSRGLPWIRGGAKAFDRNNIRAAIDASLQRLGTDYVDLYQLHWPERNTPMFGGYQFDPAQEHATTPIRAQLEALVELVREGKVRYIGLSNEHPWGVMEFLRLANEHSLPRVVSIQNSYSLINRTFDYGLAEIAYREQVGLLAYSPLAFGYLSGKYHTDPKAQGRLSLFPEFGQRYAKPNVRPAVAAYVELARQHGLSPTQLALAFVFHRSCVTSTIIGTTTLEQLRENLTAWNTTLSKQALADIEATHLRFTNPAP
ncbi:MAG: NADP(H)-dependent aldo-keto reductase [Gammaproteobacteria bacterium]|nr:NADP(H)-dependent aldo-keto reductase [Gammaproteobacteria bacterium]